MGCLDPQEHWRLGHRRIIVVQPYTDGTWAYLRNFIFVCIQGGYRVSDITPNNAESNVRNSGHDTETGIIQKVCSQAGYVIRNYLGLSGCIPFSKGPVFGSMSVLIFIETPLYPHKNYIHLYPPHSPIPPTLHPTLNKLNSKSYLTVNINKPETLNPEPLTLYPVDPKS